MRSTNILALDFDGLLVDGLNECVLVSWNGHFGESLDCFSDEGLARIPSAFIDKFKNHRSFAKHLGHFLMPFQAELGLFKTQAEFDAAYAALNPRLVERFVTRVSDYRSDARQTFRSRWLAYHQFYPGLAHMLRTATWPTCIVTAKDSDSVQALLRHADVQIPDAHVYGECLDKVAALDIIGEYFLVPRHEISFFDDNVLHARAAHQAGFRAHWAVWGYHAPEHFAIATAAGLPAVTLEDFIGVDAQEAA
jgi:phosphoglycolate phosphatase-like HAD superfamily hydrolase